MAEKKKRSKEISQAVKDRMASTLSATVESTFLGDTKEEREIDNVFDNATNADSIEDKHKDEELLNNDTSSEYMENQLNEMTNKFLETSDKLHTLEDENFRLVSENNLLKGKCQELEKEIKSLEDNLFAANIDISEKLSKITSLESTIESIKNGSLNRYSIKCGANTVKGLNGYESWN